MNVALTDRRDILPTGPRCNGVRSKTLAAPGPENHIRRPLDDFHRVTQNPVLRERTAFHLVGKDVIATRNIDDFADPLNSGDERHVPFLEVDTRPAPECRSALSHLFEVL